MKLIPLTQGQFAMIDDADYEAVSQFNWRAMKVGRRFYAVRSIRKPDGKWTTQYLHQFLLPGVAEIDHRDGNGCNDQMENLRSTTHQQNSWGFRRKKPGATSKFRGVSWCRTLLKWTAHIDVDGKGMNLGSFTVEEDAARARDVATRKYCGKGAQLNFP